MCTWGVNNGHIWDYAAAGPSGLTPLHFAALLGDGGHVADKLTGQFLSDYISRLECGLAIHVEACATMFYANCRQWIQRECNRHLVQKVLHASGILSALLIILAFVASGW